ncbi:MAG: hypothetical protein HOW73_33685 [Polyangiaceae bacterium]|nr:hypothetical protein [Polyangiaceae bacterium]
MRLGDALPVAFVLAGLAAGIGSQIVGRASHREIKETTETYLLPPPQHLVVMSLGYRAAIADVLWANVLVTQGLRLGERRRFDTAVEYLQAINELEPKWRDPYRSTEALVTLQAKATPIEQVYAVRRILERGVRERPMDAELWLILGQFTGQIAPGTYLEDDPVEAEKWRREGSEYLARAAELAPSDPTIAWQTIGAGKVFARSGRLERAIELYSVILATTTDAELRERMEVLLAQLQRDKQEAEAETRRRALHEVILDRFPGMTVSGALLLGPAPDPALCAGGARAPAADQPGCASGWTEWAERTKRSRR